MVCSLCCFKDAGMATVGDAAINFKKLADGFESMVQRSVKDNGALMEDYVIDQLHSGLNGREKAIRPTYLTDPWFNTKDAGQWYKNPEGYMKWKTKIRPPGGAPSYLGHAPRDAKTPNLIIRGDFYDSITAVPVSGGLRMESRGTSFGADVVKKYGTVLLGVGSKGRGHFVEYVLRDDVKAYFKLFGL